METETETEAGKATETAFGEDGNRFSRPWGGVRFPLLALGATILLACSSSPRAALEAPEESAPPEKGGAFFPPVETVPDPFDLGATCDVTRRVTPSGVPLVVRDREVLARFGIDRVLRQILTTAGHETESPEMLLRRVFDTENTTSGASFSDATHCDTPANPAFRNQAASSCPRAEGALAKSTHLFTANHPDHFEPVAIVQRFDLISNAMATCGEYRIVYAKTSGRTDPKNRLFMIFEAALANPKRTLAACRPMADRISRWEKDADRARVAKEMEDAFFVGGEGLAPIIHAAHYGFKAADCTYAGECGQLRLGEGMEAPWELRELRLSKDTTPLQFVPTTAKASPVPAFFAAATYEGEFLREVLIGDLVHLTRTSIPTITTSLGDAHNGGVSTLSGAAAPDYARLVSESASGTTFLDEIRKGLAKIPEAQCDSDPLTPEHVLHRASGVSCAGCHAPEKFMGPERKLGCGLSWPKSLGETHIDESGKLSDALTSVYLPHRARVLTKYLQACDVEEVKKNLVPTFMKACFTAGTAISMADGTTKPIERIEVGDRVLSYDERHARIVAGDVVQTFVHPNTDHLVTVNGTLRTTANHPFYSAGAWVNAEELSVGTPLLSLGQGFGLASRIASDASVTALEMQDGTATTYNFEVAEHHDYFAGGYLVHNKK